MTGNGTHRMDRIGLWLADFAIKRPMTLILGALTLVVLAASGARFVEFSNNYRVFFSPENPELVAFEEFQATYTKNDNVLFVIKPTDGDADGDVFQPELLAAIEALTEEAWQIPYAIRVDSITNFQHSWADGDDLTVEDLVRDGATMDGAALAEKRRIALEEPLLNGLLLAADAQATGVNVTLQFPEESLAEVPEAATAIRALAAKFEAENPGTRVALSGLVMLNNAFAEAGIQDMMTLVPIMYGVLLLTMVLVLRSLTGTIVTFMVIGMSTATAIGLAGYLGIQLTPISATAPTVILTLAIADSVHILVSLLAAMRDGKSKLEATREAMRVNFLAVGVTSLTTIVGFLALNFSDAPPFRDLGNITAMGIASAWLYSVTFLPAMIRLLPVRVAKRRKASSSLIDRALGAVADLVTARHRAVLTVTLIVVAALIAFVPTLELDDQWVKYFDQRVTFRNDADYAMEHLTGLYQVEYSLGAGEAEGISDPAYLASLERFTGWLRTQPEVRHVYSYSDVIRRLNKNMHGDDQTYERVPENRQLAAQYLLLYELSLPLGLDLNDRISIDKSATRVTATMGELSTADVRRFLSKADVWLAAEGDAFAQKDATGATVMFSHISERNIESMLSGNAIAVALISLILMLSLRSLKLGVLSLVPNAVPIFVTFGLWAVLVGQVGMAAATVSATSLGLIVDSTVHFLTKFLRARRERGLSRAEAVRYAFDTVGRAIVFNGLILIFGFAVLAASTFKINSEMGLLTAIAIAVAIIVDFLLLPALLMIGHQQERKEHAHQPALQTV